MDFVAVVDQVIALLRQRGRMTYRTLQRQFQLDDDALHDLTDEILYAHPGSRRCGARLGLDGRHGDACLPCILFTPACTSPSCILASRGRTPPAHRAVL